VSPSSETQRRKIEEFIANWRPKEEKWKNLLRSETQRKWKKIGDPKKKNFITEFGVFVSRFRSVWRFRVCLVLWFCGFVPLLADRRKEFQSIKKKKREEEEEDGGDMRGE
jgi:hypothetical protein